MAGGLGLSDGDFHGNWGRETGRLGSRHIPLAVSLRPRARVWVIVRVKRRWEVALGARRRARLELAKMRADIVIVVVKVWFMRGN